MRYMANSVDPGGLVGSPKGIRARELTAGPTGSRRAARRFAKRSGFYHLPTRASSPPGYNGRRSAGIGLAEAGGLCTRRGLGL